ncbi:hypothetical protein GF407_18920 [candidate division KSB1 bacterium]|nr:hypothetical protein [candidate division KSB1 bacterium]
MDIWVRSGYPRHNLNNKWQQVGIWQNRMMTDNGRIMEGDCGGGDPPRATRALPLSFFGFLPLREVRRWYKNPWQ